MTVTPLRQATPEYDTSDAVSDNPPDDSSQPESKTPRGQSTIAFPYADLSDALDLAKTIRNKGGAPVAKDQLAAAMDHTALSGAFSAKLNAARMFGLVKLIAGKVKISDLGYEAIDSDEVRSKTARVTAFLNVPLFARTYEEFRNRQLPPRPHGLEEAFVGFGVLEKRKRNARWAFDRSARQAGFFDNGDDRLIAPIVAKSQALSPEESREDSDKVARVPDTPKEQRTGNASELPKAAEQPLIKGLLEHLPEPKTTWSLKARARWLRALAVNLAYIYGQEDEAELVIQEPTAKVSLAPAKATAPFPAKPPAPVAPAPSQAISSSDLDDEIPF